MLICVTVLILEHDLFNYFHIGNVNTQNNVDETGPQLVVEPPPQGLFPLSDIYQANWAMDTNEDSRQSRIPVNDLDWKLHIFVKVVRKKARALYNTSRRQEKR